MFECFCSSSEFPRFPLSFRQTLCRRLGFALEVNLTATCHKLEKELGGSELEGCSHFLLGGFIRGGWQVAIIFSMHLHFFLSVVCVAFWFQLLVHAVCVLVATATLI